MDRIRITVETFERAAAGDPEAREILLDAYRGEFDKLSMKTTRLRDGRLVTHIDEDMRHQIKQHFLNDLPNLAKKLRAEAERGSAQ